MGELVCRQWLPVGTQKLHSDTYRPVGSQAANHNNLDLFGALHKLVAIFVVAAVLMSHRGDNKIIQLMAIVS